MGKIIKHYFFIRKLSAGKKLKLVKDGSIDRANSRVQACACR